MEFEGKTAVITGAAGGIGRAVALAMAKLGTDIVIADIDREGIERVCGEITSIGRRALAVRCDISQDADVENLASRSITEMGKVDILMNNAGVLMRGLVEKVSIADWEWILNINVLGAARGVRAFIPHMLARGSGYIVNTSSSAGLIASQPAAVAMAGIPYAASKFAVVGLTEGLYSYLYPRGIMVSVLCPGIVATNLPSGTHYIGDTSEEVDYLKSDLEKQFDTQGGLPILQPDDVAQMVVAAMKEERFLIISHREVKDLLMNRGQDTEKLENHLKSILTSRRRSLEKKRTSEQKSD